VAQSAANGTIEAGRAAVAGLCGMSPDGVAFVEGASAAHRALLHVWPLPAGARIGVAGTEWGPNRERFAEYGHKLVELPVDGAGVIDVDAVPFDELDLVHVTQVASHRGVVQPVRDLATLCRAHGVALWVDAAQALGHVDTATGADAVYGTSRKWLAGPRGVGVLAVAQRNWPALRVRPSAMEPGGLAPVRYLDSHDAHVAGRVGFACAVAEHLSDGPARVQAALAAAGELVRDGLADLPGWRADEGSSAIVALFPLAGQDVEAIAARLLAEHRILTTACLPARAPADTAGPLLRISPHVDVDAAAVNRLRRAIVTLS
jgi:pyridoxal 5-phosphate dependent beta-lyase